MAYDKVGWHSGAVDYPDNLPYENGGTHIGMFLTWLIDNDLISNFHKEDSQEGIDLVRSRVITGRDFLFDYCDEQFGEEFVVPKVLKFVERYYNNKYLHDYNILLCNGLNVEYEVENTWDNYKKIAPIINKRYSRYLKYKKIFFWI